MTLKINPIVAIIISIIILILLFLLFKGCDQSKLEVAKRKKAEQITDSALQVLQQYKRLSDSTARDFEDTTELLRGQNALLVNQKDQAEIDLNKALADNKELIAKHNLAQYADTASVTVPQEYVQECESCFTKLETTTNLSIKYKADLNNLQSNWDKQNQVYVNRLKALDQEKLAFYNRINLLTRQQEETQEKLKPHGRLYLSWGILWHGWPSAAGGGLMYQTKYNMIYGAKCYYGANGMQIETTMNFPLSIKL